MTMMNWNDYRDQLLGRAGELGKLSPDTVTGSSHSIMRATRPSTSLPRFAS